MSGFFSKHRKWDPFQTQLGDDETGYRRDVSLPRFLAFEESGLFAEGGSERRSGHVGKTVGVSRIGIFFLIAFLSFGLLFGRSAYLQIGRGEDYKNLAEGNRIRIETVPAERGVMYDRSGVELVYNIPRFSLVVVPADLPRDTEARRHAMKIVAQKFSLNEEDIVSAIEGKPSFSFEPIVLKENLSNDEAILLSIGEMEWTGFALETAAKRFYISRKESLRSLSHVIGYEGKITDEELEQRSDYALSDRIGKIGLEYSYEPVLRGEDGKKEVEVDARGQEKNVLAEAAPVAGKNLLLAIDAALQEKSQTVLEAYLKLYKKKQGSVIILDPNNGEILTLVSWPAFDNNAFSQGISEMEYQSLLNDPSKPLFNRSITGEYPSGSTFKAIVGAAALNEGIINRATSFVSTGGLSVGGSWFPDWKAGGHGITDVARALAESINTFFYIIGGGYDNFRGLGVEKITEYAKKFGLGKRLGIDIPGERPGFLPSKEWKEKTKGERWYVGDTYHYAIGQGDVLVTPLQVVGWISVFANGGILYEPHLVKALSESSGNVIQNIEPTILSSAPVSKNAIDAVRIGLRRAVLSGSARRLGDLPVTSAGKTGTAEWADGKSPHAWFAGFAPYEKPEIAIVVLVEEGVEGSAVSLSVAHDILDWYFSVRKPEMEKILN